MAMNPLPPQAYTKDTLLKAYSWLQNQNDSIKALAITPDILVSLFLKAKMNGEESLERPSIQNFKAELKNLAGMMGEFEAKIERPYDKPQYHPVDKSVDKPVEKPTPPPIPMSPAPQAAYESPKLEVPRETARHQAANELDEKSKIMIREVKTQFNLSNDQEALRLLISIGYKRMKNLE